MWVWRAHMRVPAPTFVQAGVQHYLLWCNRPLSAEELEEALTSRVPSDLPSTHWVNPTPLQSVPSVCALGALRGACLNRRRPCQAADKNT
jgi:hypothetical protein